MPAPIFQSLLALNPVWAAFVNCDLVGQAIVIFLFLGSAYAWTIMVDKNGSLKKARRQAERFKEQFRGRHLVLSAYKDASATGGLLGDIYLRGANQMLSYLSLSPEQAVHYGSTHCPSSKLSTAQVETIRSIMERAVADKILELEDRMGMLANAVSVSPYIGLFGTVWGVMLAYCGICLAGKPDIAAMSAGISGALLTTVAGLVVAIPSTFGYNLLSNDIKRLVVYMDNFVEEFMVKLILEQHEMAVETAAEAKVPQAVPMEVHGQQARRLIVEHHVQPMDAPAVAAQAPRSFQPQPMQPQMPAPAPYVSQPFPPPQQQPVYLPPQTQYLPPQGTQPSLPQQHPQIPPTPASAMPQHFQSTDNVHHSYDPRTGPAS